MSERDPLGIVGQVVAEKYRVERLVGEGGFAVVYRATHAIWNKPVAIKFFNALSTAPVDQRDHFQKAFIQEGALLTELSSETASIVQARDVGTYTTPDGAWMPFMVLEWLDGQALDEILDRERAQNAPAWPLAEVVRLLGQAAAALDVAHGRGVAHRDVKPANLFVLGDPHGKATLKVLDFGVAKMVSDDTQLKAALAKTGMGVSSFTPQYGAPEQFTRSYGATGPWTDVYALALVAVEMLTARSALEGEDLIQLAFSSGNPEKRPTPRALGLSVSDAVEAVFRKALAVQPGDRYARALPFWRELEAAAAMPGSLNQTAPRAVDATELAPAVSASAVDTLSSAKPSHLSTGSPSTISQTSPRSSRSGAIVGAVAAIAVVGAGLFFAFGRSKPEAPSVTAAMAPAPKASSAPPAPPPEPTCSGRMVKIPAGQFFQGSDAKGALDNEKPSHNVALGAFCMDLYEVTAGEYRACSDVGKCRRAGTEVEWPGITAKAKKTYSPLCTIDDSDRADHPINCVSWDMADRYCKVQGKRLPTEAEWEYATRGPDGRVYPWGDEEPTEKHLNACGKECVAWGRKNQEAFSPLYAADDGYPTTSPVGRFEAGKSRFGPYDVVGNVWEWVADWYGPYTTDEKKNPTGPETGERRVMRGGAWNGEYSTWLRPSFRYSQDPSALSHGIGFRCAQSL